MTAHVLVRPAALALLLCACRAEQETFAENDGVAPPDGPVVDAADIIESEEEAALDRRLRDYWNEERTAIVVSTVDSLGGRTIEDYAFNQFNAWGIGDDATDRGVLILVAPTERETRIEVGCGLETVLTDEVAQQIMDEDLILSFRDGAYAEGIEAGVNGIVQALDESEVAPGPVSELCLEQAA